MPSDITADVANVLSSASRADGDHPNFLTAYQILNRLPEHIRTRLIQERTLGGRGAGVSYGAPSVVSDAAEMLPNIKVDYIDNRGMQVEVAGQTITPGFEVCGIYRLTP
jgi:hypothetical protein